MTVTINRNKLAERKTQKSRKYKNICMKYIKTD